MRNVLRTGREEKVNNGVTTNDAYSKRLVGDFSDYVSVSTSKVELTNNSVDTLGIQKRK